jgi:glucokinase
VILAGDIGGTKTHLALYAPDGDIHAPLFERQHPSQEARSLGEIVGRFLENATGRPTRAVFGIAGPVVDNRSDTTNLPWDVDARALGEQLGGAAVTLINDLVATAHGLDTLRDEDFIVLAPGTAASGNRALIAAGTGLGEALLPWDGTRWTAMASEGGHSDFAPRDTLEDELLVWLRAKYGRVSCERILSGPGLAGLYRFMRATGRGDEPASFTAAFDGAPDPAATVTAAALDGTCARAALTVDHFMEIYGAEAGNLALKGLAVGGLFVGGGIAPRLRALLPGSRFAKAFADKGRLSPLMESIPIKVILDSQTALWGAAALALATAAEDNG